jgi:ABC-type branched-subunit amino acid transport system ATPase component/ABC-type branched-subunit amino acid transport system permease subunit
MTRKTLLIAAVGLVLVFSPPAGLIPGWTPALATNVALTALALIGLNIIFGVAGMLAFGQAAFMVVPAYFGGALERAGLSSGLAIAIGLAVGVMLARALAELFVRLPGVYLAFGTLGFGFVVEGLARAFPAWTGGASGLVFSAGRAISQEVWYVLAIVALVLGLVGYALLMRGAMWRRLRTVKHDELVAWAVGIDVTQAKVRAFTIGCFYACVAGTLLCYYVGVVVPEDAGAQKSLSQIGMVIMGGPALALGPVVGALLVAWLFFAAGYGGNYESLVYGIFFLLAVLYAKNGLLGLLPQSWLGEAPAKPHLVTADVAVQPDPPDKPARAGVCLRVENVGKRFQGLVALEDVSFEVAAGEVFALVGPNGAGKSTLFNVICGIIEPTTGNIAVDGHDLAALPIHRRAPLIGRAFQVARLVPDLTAAENVMVRIDNITPDYNETERRVMALAQLKAFDLLQHADEAVSTLSIGQHKLIDLARAAAGDPVLVLLDEPAVGLTESELVHLKEVISKLQMRGIAVVIVEHNIDFVSSVASRGLVLDSGHAVVTGAMRDILADERVQKAYFGALT